MIFCRMAPPAIHSVEQSVAYEELGFCDSSHLDLAFSLCFPQSTHPTLIWDPSMSWKPWRKEEYRESVGASHILRRSFQFCVSSQICLLLGNPFPLHSDFPHFTHVSKPQLSPLCPSFSSKCHRPQKHTYKALILSIFYVLTSDFVRGYSQFWSANESKEVVFLIQKSDSQAGLLNNSPRWH